MRKKPTLWTTAVMFLAFLVNSTALAQPALTSTSPSAFEFTSQKVPDPVKAPIVSGKPVKPPQDLTAYITSGNVFFRTGPSSADSIIDYLLKGTPVTLVSKSSSTWYEVSYNGKTGYVSSSYLTALTAPRVGTYSLLRTVKTYSTASDAQLSVNGTGVLPSGTYNHFSTENGMLLISKTKISSAAWINPADNEVLHYFSDPLLGSRLDLDQVYSDIKTLSTDYSSRAFGTDSARFAAAYLASQLEIPVNGVSYYTVEQQISQAVNPLLGTELVDVINVVAKPQNYDSTKRDVLFIAHYDTVLNTPGANDNASGTAMLLELARYFAVNPVNFNPVFLIDGGEEKGKPGTTDYLSKNRDRIKNATEAIINLDMVGMSQNYQLWNLDAAMQNSYYTNLAYKIGKSLGLQIELKLNSNGIADYKMFELEKIPTVTFMNITTADGATVPYYHTPADTIDTIDRATLSSVSAMLMNMIEYISNKPQ